MNVCLVLVTHNRLGYTKKTIDRLLEDPSEEFELYIWDNASTDGTRDYLRDELKDPRIVETVLSDENVGPLGAMNYAWSKTKADLVGKLDNDCLLTPGWTRILAKAHEDIENLGAIACWHYPLDEFDEKAARKVGKIQSFGNYQVLRSPFVCGTGFLMKRKTFEQYGPWMAGPNVGTTYYYKKMAIGGWINGWYFPFVLQEHMDDPKSSHCILTDDESIQKMHDVTFVLRKNNIKSMKDRWMRRKFILRNLNSGPWEVKYYMGWRRKLRGIQRRMHYLIWRIQNWACSL
jgi:glycosyltransferase involved in cell wall biosynthesis